MTTTALVPIASDLESLTDRVYRELRDAIVTKRLSPGSVVTESALAAQLGVSKTPVREALLQLRGSRLVEAHGRRGLRVAEPSMTALFDALAVRSGLESTAAGLAALNATDAERAELTRLAKQHNSKGATPALSIEAELGWLFHLTLLEASHNSYLVSLATDVRAFTEVMERRDLNAATSPHSRTEAGHLVVAKAIATGDKDGAEEAMRAHFQALTSFYETV